MLFTRLASITTNQRTSKSMAVPSVRIRSGNSAPHTTEGEYVLYWMIANRRLHYNYSLDRAIEWASELKKPLLIFEALRCGYEWASDRIHKFVLEGMADNQRVAEKSGVSYLPYAEPDPGDGSGLLQSLADKACVVITDDFPCFFLPQMVTAVADRLPVKLEAIDSNGLYPMRDTERVFTRAFSFRNHLQKTLTPFLTEFPDASPLSGKSFPKSSCIPADISERWPAAGSQLLENPGKLSAFAIDHNVGPALVRGGESAARKQLKSFVSERLERYADDRNQPDIDPSSGLSPYLHFGHISAHEVFRKVTAREEWSVGDLADVRKTRGSREGWWGMSPTAEGFMDELITWREIGYNACCHDPDYDKYESLPDFAKITLAEHAADRREYIYSYEQFRDSRTHDEIWNAAQNQLVTEGRMHNYLRMLWGKKILEWTETPQQALKIMIDLNNRYALDGRNPNSYSGIFWVLGRYDRAWGPVRPVFGKIRFMSSDSTRKKLKLKNYLQKYGVKDAGQLF